MDNKLSMQDSIILACGFVLLIWLIKLFEVTLGVSLATLGVLPQTASGLVGVVAAPLIHVSWQHVLSNTLPILLLGSMLIYGYPASRWRVLIVVWLVSGLGVWWFARSSYHMGASGIAHGMFFYLFVAGILRRDKRSSALLMVAFFMYGSMFWTIFPNQAGVSFEYHFFGALSGAVCAIVFRHRDPVPEKKMYSWDYEAEENDEDEDDVLIGDEWKVETEPSEPGRGENTTGDGRH